MLRLLTSDAPDPYLSLEDDALMALVVRGEENAFTALVLRHDATLRGFLARYVGAESDDLAQEVWATIWRTRERYEDQGRFTVFLFRVGRNRALSHLRWRKVRRVFAERPREARHAENAGLARVLDGERDASLMLVVRGLPGAYRDVLLLHYAQGLDYESVSAILDVGVSTLRSRAHRGLAMLRTRLARQDPA